MWLVLKSLIVRSACIYPVILYPVGISRAVGFVQLWIGVGSPGRRCVPVHCGVLIVCVVMRVLHIFDPRSFCILLQQGAFM